MNARLIEIARTGKTRAEQLCVNTLPAEHKTAAENLRKKFSELESAADRDERPEHEICTALAPCVTQLRRLEALTRES